MWEAAFAKAVKSYCKILNRSSIKLTGSNLFRLCFIEKDKIRRANRRSLREVIGN